MTEKERRDAVEEAVLRRALGYEAEEVVEEYAGEDGILVKRKVTKKAVPPDIAAARLIIGDAGPRPVSELSDEELAAEKRRLLALLVKSEEGYEDGENQM